MNRLEELLQEASQDPGAIPDFYAELLRATVYVLGASDDPTEGSRIAEAGTALHLQTWESEDGTLAVPFFTSIDTLSASIDREMAYVGLEARALFEMASGSNLVLNPRSETGKWFTPDEIATLASGDIPRAGESYEVEKETTILVGEPAEFPAELASALTRYFSQTKAVQEAYLLQALFPDETDPTLLIGVDIRGDAESVIEETVLVASNASDRPCSVVAIDASGLGEAFRAHDPIYRKGWGTALKRLLG